MTDLANIDIDVHNRLPRDNSIVVFFRKLQEFDNRVFNFLDNHPETDDELRDGGTIITTKDAIGIFREENFDFVTAKDMKELYFKYKEELREYAQQIRDFYGLPRRIYT